MILMTQRQFAEHVGFSAWTVSQWAERGWLVLCDNKIDAEASVQRLKERRPGGLKKMTRRAAAKISHWSGKRGMTS